MLEIRNLDIRLNGRILIDDLSFVVGAGEVAAIMGPSGSGKSTILNWIIGALDPAFSADGELILMGTRRDRLSTEKRRIGILFQDDLLFPHLTVGQNLAFALPREIRGGVARLALVEEALQRAGLGGFYDRDPSTLSGGQRARASLMRALLGRPDALLLDEPFSRLDRQLRSEFAGFVFDEIKRMYIPTLMVTHDPLDVPSGGQVIALKKIMVQNV